MIQASALAMDVSQSLANPRQRPSQANVRSTTHPRGRTSKLLAPAAEAVAANDWMTSSERQTALERISIRHSIANLRTFPCVSILEDKGRLSLHGAWFDISDGDLWVMDPETGDFSKPSLESA